jgi:hypothetical protein
VSYLRALHFLPNGGMQIMIGVPMSEKARIQELLASAFFILFDDGTMASVFLGQARPFVPQNFYSDSEMKGPSRFDNKQFAQRFFTGTISSFHSKGYLFGIPYLFLHSAYFTLRMFLVRVLGDIVVKSVVLSCLLFVFVSKIVRPSWSVCCDDVIRVMCYRELLHVYMRIYAQVTGSSVFIVMGHLFLFDFVSGLIFFRHTFFDGLSMWFGKPLWHNLLPLPLYRVFPPFLDNAHLFIVVLLFMYSCRRQNPQEVVVE